MTLHPHWLLQVCGIGPVFMCIPQDTVCVCAGVCVSVSFVMLLQEHTQATWVMSILDILYRRPPLAEHAVQRKCVHFCVCVEHVLVLKASKNRDSFMATYTHIAQCFRLAV